MNPGDDHELRLLHARRRWILSERRGHWATFAEDELRWLRERIDALEVGLPEWRNSLLWRLKFRMIDLWLKAANQ